MASICLNKLIVSICLLLLLLHCTGNKSNVHAPVFIDGISDYVHENKINTIFYEADSSKYILDYKRSCTLFKNILERQNLSDEERCYVYNQLGYIYLCMQKDTLAEIWVDSVRTNFNDAKNLSPGAQADYWYNKGLVAYRFFKPENARTGLLKALTLYGNVYRNGRHQKIAKTNAHLAMVYYDFEKDVQPFFEYAEKSYSIIQKQKNLWPYSIDTELAMMYVSSWKRNHAAAKAHCYNLIQLASAVPDTNKVALAKAISMDGRLLLWECRMQKKPVDPAVERIKESIEIGNFQPGAHQLELTRHLARSVVNLKDSTLFWKTVNDLEHKESIYGRYYAYPDRLKALYWLNRDSLKLASDYYLAFLKKHEQDSCLSEQVLDETYINLSDIYASQGQFDRAFYHIAQVITHETPLQNSTLNDKQLLQSRIYGASPFPFFTLNKIGHLFLKRYDKDHKTQTLKNALSAFEISDKLMFANNNVYDENIIINFQKEIGASLYEGALETLLKLDSIYPKNTIYRNMTPHFMDRMKSDVLFRYLPDNIPSDSLRILKGQIDAALSQKSGLLNSQQLAQDLYQLDKIQFVPKSQKSSFLTATSIQRQLSGQEAVIQYGIYTTHAYMLYIDAANVQFQRINLSAVALKDSILRFSTAVSNPNSSIADMAPTGCKLDELLLKPVNHLLKNKTDWIIIPDAVLCQLPFEALLTEEEWPPGSAIPYIINQHNKIAISYSPAWKIWSNSIHNHVKEITRTKAVFYNYGGKKDGLICSDEELMALKNAGYVVTPMINQQCSKSDFLKQWSQSQGGIVHLSLHGAADQEDIFSNKIWFGTNNTDVMYGFEVSNVAGQADMVVLSVCETGLGQHNAGEGAYSMSRSFFQAGAKSMLASYWKIDNCANSDLIRIFYQQFRYSKGAKSLSDAKRLYLSAAKGGFKHPHYWAGMVYME